MITIVNTLHRSIRSWSGLLLLTSLLFACALPGPTPTGASQALPSMAPTEAPASPSPEPPTPAPASPTPEPSPSPTAEPPALNWRQVTTYDGLCTDHPLFIGDSFIGTGMNTFCIIDEVWTPYTIPQAQRVNGVHRFPPGGGWIAVTDVGWCVRFDTWECHPPQTEFPFEEALSIVPLGVDPVFRLRDSVAYNEQKYNLPQIVAAAEARPTWVAISGDPGSIGPEPEIWIGTNGYGIVVVQPRTGQLTRYTTADGLPGDTIRDISTESCPKFCDYRDIWVATDRGIGHWDGQHWNSFTTADGLPSDDIRGVAAYERNKLWAATGNGAAHFDGQRWEAYPPANGFPDVDLNGVLHYGERILFSTRDDGLIILP